VKARNWQEFWPTLGKVSMIERERWWHEFTVSIDGSCLLYKIVYCF
jgi:hypothetical protein